MSSTTHNKKEENIPLLEQANDSAKQMTLRWIQDVFQQTFCQTLAQVWTLQENKLHISHENIQICDKMCTRLGILWCRRLRNAGQDQMAEWVHQVLETKQFILLLQDGHETTTTSTATLENDTNETNTTATLEVEPLELPEHATNNKLMLTKIRQLGQRNIMGDVEKQEVVAPERVSKTLDMLGRNHDTNWPLEWNIIETAVLENHKRLHLQTLYGKPRSNNQNNKKVTYEVVPKSLAISTQDNHDDLEETNAILAAKEPLAKMVERKRKMQEAIVVASPPSTTTPPPLPLLARRPSTFSQEQRFSFQKDIVASLPIQEREKLERNMIHTPNSNDEEESTQEWHSILGALQNVGDVHFQLQHLGSTSMEDYTENKERREQQRAKRQRLFPRQAIQQKETKRAATKVVRSVKGEEQWMELDMGSCLMNVIDSDTHQKKLCAFSSLEIMLQDEDAQDTMASSNEQQESNVALL